MKNNYTISAKGNLRKNQNYETKTYILKEDNYELTFKELFDKLLIFSNKIVHNKKFGLARLYQTPRKEITIEKILQGDSNYKQHFINILTLDFDSTEVTREFVEDQLINYEFISYHSFSHTVKEGNRFRILINLKNDVDLKKINQKIKKNILEEFRMDTDAPESESIKDGWMALPAFYEGKRKSEVKYNIGDKLDLNSLIDKIKLEMEIKSKTKSKINKKVNDEKGFNKNRQNQTFENLKDELFNTKTGDKHNSIVTFISRSSWIGIHPSEIRKVIYYYEENESKLNNWIDLIEDWRKDDIISYYYREEYKIFNDEYILFDNLTNLYYDTFSKKWLNKQPRRNKKDLINLLETDRLFKYLYSETSNFLLSKKLYDFINKILDKYDSNDMIEIKKYAQPINKGVAFSKKVYKIIMFDIFKFKNIDNLNETIKTEDLLNINLGKDDDQTIMLKVLKKLIWVRKEKVTGENGYYGWKTFFSPKTSLFKIMQ